MKLLIVEDEIKTLNGIVKLIHSISKEYEIVGTAKNGREGVQQALEKNPDVILTDIRMNEMNGLEMMKALHERKFSCKYIIISGYADFEYAREAMALGSVEYLLKPMTKEELQRVLQKVSSVIECESNAIQISDLEEEELLEKIMILPEKEKVLYEQEFKKRFADSQNFQLLLVKMENSCTKKVEQMIRDQIRNITNVNRLIAFCTEDRREIYVVFHEAKEEQLKRNLKKCQETLLDNVGVKIVFSWESFQEIDGFENVKQKIQDNVSWNLSLKTPTVIDEALIKTIKCKKFIYPATIEKEITAKIQKSEFEEIKELLESFVVYLRQDTYSFTDIREAMVCMTVAIMYAIKMSSYGVYENFKHLDLMNWIQRLLFPENYIQIIMNIIQQYEKYNNNLYRTKHPLVNKALTIIEDKYKSDISLGYVADLLNVTPEYLGKIFTTEIGMKFTTYCIQRRVSCAKQMLSENHQKIYEVSELCGFSDVKYFCKVFKKYTGISPGEYQKVQKLV